LIEGRAFASARGNKKAGRSQLFCPASKEPLINRHARAGGCPEVFKLKFLHSSSVIILSDYAFAVSDDVGFLTTR
jgi:hypothetical protein